MSGGVEVRKYKDEILINSIFLKGKIEETKSFLVFRGSVEDKWIDIVRNLYNFTNDSFFLGFDQEYPEDCGWYVNLKDVKSLLEDILEKISDESNYHNIVKMMGKYNSIIEGVNSKIDEEHHLPTLNSCNNAYCIFNLNNKCHQIHQEDVEPNSIDCSKSIRADYYDIYKGLKSRVIKRVNSMSIDQLVKFIGDKVECQEG